MTATALRLLLIIATGCVASSAVTDEPQLLAGGAKPADARPAKLTVALHSGGAAEDLKALREALEKAPGIKFKADEIKFSDFGRDGGLFTSFFALEITDLAKTDVGAIAKALAAANTSKKEKCPPELFLIFRYRPGSTKNEPLRAALAKVKGVQPAKSWAGDANLWVSVDSSGQGTLAEVTGRSMMLAPSFETRLRTRIDVI